jgi:histidinol-phosphate aminotransferase
MREHPAANANVLLMRTLSKFGLAGVRLGYLLGPQALVQEVDKLRPPYNVSVLNAECALFALEHTEVFAAQAAQICEERTVLIEALAQMPGVRPFPSDANMVLARVPDAQRCFDALKSRGLLVKNVSRMHPLLGQCLRLTVGTPLENASLISALPECL